MESEQETTQEEEGTNGAIPPTIFDEIRKDHEKIGRGRTVTVPIPGYHGNLVVRYKWVAREELTKKGRKLAARVQDPDALDILASCDVLLTTCDEILVLVGEEEKALDDPPVTFSNSKGILKHLGIDSDSAREAVRTVFNNDYAVVKTAVAISRWLEDTTREVDLETLGL